MKILLIDNYDSFTYNLVQMLSECGATVEVFRNDRITPAAIRAKRPDGLVISPGPGTPQQAGISLAAIRELHAELPILGVCLGHQSIGEVFGGSIVRSPALMHGKVSDISHNGQGIYQGLSNPFTATRYHSLMVAEESIKLPLVIESRAADGEVMGLRHQDYPVFGVQFHPESILTVEGRQLLANFLTLCRA
ncbi:MAG TPA: aminodeoxychorismate/anthranilate synthase component II [bacterium]|nr:aminodeoxychorismate/anthranilate synthase component II [bacterium]